VSAPPRRALPQRPATPPLEALRAWRAAHGPPTQADVVALGRTTGLPASTVRAAFEGYADLRDGECDRHACAGTACWLAGGDANPTDRASAERRAVSCLGHCHAGPATLRTGEGVVSGPSGPCPEPDVRCRASRPVVTGRLDTHRGLAAARSVGVWSAYAAARGRSGDVLVAVEDAGLRGRGGAAFPTGWKWRAAAEAHGDQRVVIANGDEGDPGSFVDRLLLERDPHGVLEGLALCALAVGASRAFVFVRSEYPSAQRAVAEAIAEAEDAGLIGPDVGLEVEMVVGLGSYVCGEETALLGTIEGGPPRVRARPPFPTTSGLYGCPTVVDNVETLVAARWIVAHGAGPFRALGTQESSGTKAISITADFERTGVVEVEFGISLREVIAEAGGSDLGAVLLGGPMGSVLTPERWDVVVCYHRMRAAGVQLGHGGLIPIPIGTDLRALALHLSQFMQEESCGACAPCRIGSERLRDRVEAGDASGAADLGELIAATSLCAFGHFMPGPISALLALAEGQP
jgi:NADH:ubiquinone oxidoreductase subunit F (NADH-binding)